jgi:hypothetical protein
MADVVNLLGDSSSGATGTTAISGCIPKAVWDVNTWDAFVGDVQGSPLFTGTGKPWTDLGGGKIQLTDTSNLTGGIDIYVRISNSDSGGADGYYLVTASDSDTITFDDVPLVGTATWITSGTADYSIGGIGDIRANTGGSEDLQDQFDDIGNFAADGTHNVDILINRTVNGVVTEDYSLLVNQILGSTTTRVRTISTNSSFEDDGTRNLTIDTSTELATGLFDIAAGANYLTFKNIIFDAGDSANYGVWMISNANYEVFENCEFLQAKIDGLHVNSSCVDTRIQNCDSHDNLNYGIYFRATNGSIYGGRFYDNQDSGIYQRSSVCQITNTRCYTNTTAGIQLDANADVCTLSNNICNENTGSGILLGTSNLRLNIFNNSCSENTVYGYLLSTPQQSIIFFGFNHAYLNGTAPSDEALTEAEFLVFSEGNNIVGDPLLDANYTPSSSSPLIDAGVGGTGDIIGALCATAGGGAGGGVMPLSGLLG